MIESERMIETTEGQIGTFVVHPESGGPHPVVLFLMDAPGKRDLLRDMCRTLATNGYYAMLPNLYYRTTDAFELDFSSKQSFQAMTELMHGVGNAMVERDAAALFAHADGDPAANASSVGCVGYCMSGPFALSVAAGHPDRVQAAASFYGVRLVVDAADSPHRRLADIAGELYIGAAEHDDYVPLEMIDEFEAALQQTEVQGRVERYWGTHHGFAFDDRPAYDARADQRHWAALLNLLNRNLAPHG